MFWIWSNWNLLSFKSTQNFILFVPWIYKAYIIVILNAKLWMKSQESSHATPCLFFHFHLNIFWIILKLIRLLRQDLDVIAVLESRISNTRIWIRNISLHSCNYEFCPIQPSAGATLFYRYNYLKTPLSHNLRNDLTIGSFEIEKG